MGDSSPHAAQRFIGASGDVSRAGAITSAGGCALRQLPHTLTPPGTASPHTAQRRAGGATTSDGEVASPKSMDARARPHCQQKRVSASSSA